MKGEPVSERTRVTMGILIGLVALFVTVTIPIGGGLLMGYGKIVETATAQVSMKAEISEIKTEMKTIRQDQQVVNDRLATAVGDLSKAVNELRVQIETSKKK